MATGPTPDLNRVVLRWYGTDFDGPSTGRLKLVYNGPVMLDDNATQPVSIYPTEIVRTITTAVVSVTNDQGQPADQQVGYASFTVPVTDDPDIIGSGGTYTLTEELTNGRGKTVNFVASKDTPGGIIYLNRLSSVDPIPGEAVSAVSVAQFTALTSRVVTLEGAAPGGGSSITSYSQVAALTGYPASFTPSAHSHAQADVTGLVSALAGKAATTHTHAQADVTGLTSALTAKADASALTSGLAGKADLVSGLVPTSQIPAIAITEFLGSVSSQAAMLALTGQKGDWCIRTDVSLTYVISGNDATVIGNWTALPLAANAVTSVAGKTGSVITLSAADVGAAPTSHSHTQADVTGLTAALGATVNTSGAQTVAGVKTFSSAPVVPDGSFAEAKVSGLVADLAGKMPADALANTNLTYAAAMALGSRPTVPTGMNIRVIGGTNTDPKPAWFIAGDWRHLFNA